MPEFPRVLGCLVIWRVGVHVRRVIAQLKCKQRVHGILEARGHGRPRVENSERTRVSALSISVDVLVHVDVWTVVTTFGSALIKEDTTDIVTIKFVTHRHRLQFERSNRPSRRSPVVF